MRRLRLLFGILAALGLGLFAATATADPFAGPPICSSAGSAVSGNYGNLTISGNAYVAARTTLSVSGDLTIAPGACLDAFTLGTVHVRGNILVDAGAILALGCTPNSLGDPTIPPCFADTTHDTVDGSILADHPLTMYLDGDTIQGSVISKYGGPGLTSDQFLNFPIKDNVIGGDLHIEHWQGGWIGAIRNHVGGNLAFSQNQSVLDPDSNEVQTNTVAGNLICFANSPDAHVNPADGGLPNVVGGLKIGQCAGL
jgi:hypothetical protein